jgi:hypothetical protein
MKGYQNIGHTKMGCQWRLPPRGESQLARLLQTTMAECLVGPTYGRSSLLL